MVAENRRGASTQRRRYDREPDAPPAISVTTGSLNALRRDPDGEIRAGYGTSQRKLLASSVLPLPT